MPATKITVPKKGAALAQTDALLVRIRRTLSDRTDVTEKKLFRGVAFMVRGNMACGGHKDRLIVRIGAAAVQEALKEPRVAVDLFEQARAAGADQVLARGAFDRNLPEILKKLGAGAA